MLKFLADENVDSVILTQSRRHLPGIDIVRASDVGLARTPDEDILQWAADNGRVVVTKDKNTMRKFAMERVAAGLPMPGLMLLHNHTTIGAAIDSIMHYAVLPAAEIDGHAVFV